MQNWDWCDYNLFVMKIHFSCKCYLNTESLEIVATFCKSKKKKNNLQKGRYFYRIILVDSLWLWGSLVIQICVFLISVTSDHRDHWPLSFSHMHDRKCSTLLGLLFNSGFESLDEEYELCWLRNCDHSNCSGQKLTVASRKTFPDTTVLVFEYSGQY